MYRQFEQNQFITGQYLGVICKYCLSLYVQINYDQSLREKIKDYKVRY